MWRGKYEEMERAKVGSVHQTCENRLYIKASAQVDSFKIGLHNIRLSFPTRVERGSSWRGSVYSVLCTVHLGVAGLNS